MSQTASRPRSRIPRRLKLTALALIIILVVATVCIRISYDRNLAAVGSSQRVHYVTVASGSTAYQIANQLAGAKLIRSSSAFQWYVSSHQLRDSLQAGTYAFKQSQTTPQIVDALVQGKVATNLVTILPGQRLDQVRQGFIDAGFKAPAVDSALSAGQYRSSFPALADNPASANLEGFLYPDSYQKTAETDPGLIVQESLTEMQKHLTSDVRNGFAKEGLTTYQGVIIASMVEKEVASPADRAKVAQVFLSRLHKGITLGSDATALYGAAINGQPASVTYDSVYNTLLHKGLPPTPIGAVSDQSLQAAAHPADTDWLYFVTGDNGKTYFSKTLAEHQALTARYCHKVCDAETEE